MNVSDHSTYSVVILLSIKNQPSYRYVEDWDIQDVLRQFDDLSSYYGFYFQKRQKTLSNRDNRELDVDIKVLETSGIYYVNCYVETIEDLRVKKKVDTFLINQMENLGVNKVVHNVKDENVTLTFPLLDNDCLVDNNGDMIET